MKVKEQTSKERKVKWAIDSVYSPVFRNSI